MNRRKQTVIPTRGNQRYFDLDAETPRSKLLAFSFAHVTEKKNYNFKSSDYRMLCIKDKKREVLYIIGFDFDFSAYDHGS